MKMYGLRIGDIGVEFSDRQAREKAMLDFTKGCCVKITDYEGQRYGDSKGCFATYERNTEEQTMNCSKCTGQFSSETCTKREIPATGYDGKFRDNDSTESKYLCDACHAKTMKDYEVFKAKKVIAQA